MPPDCAWPGVPPCLGVACLASDLPACEVPPPNDLPLTERRHKDKAFGRFIHTYKKQKGGPDQD